MKPKTDIMAAHKQKTALEIFRELSSPKRDIEAALYGTVEVDEDGTVWWIDGEGLDLEDL